MRQGMTSSMCRMGSGPRVLDALPLLNEPRPSGSGPWERHVGEGTKARGGRKRRGDGATKRWSDGDRARRGGFTFAEVLFAVMILGIGFMLVAAVLPVAIQQNRENIDQATARNVAVGALMELEAAAGNGDLAVTGAGAPFTVAPLVNFRGSRVSAIDPRFQWSVVYGRDSGPPAAGAANVFIIVQRIPREILGSNVYMPQWLINGECEPQLVPVNLKAPTAGAGSLIEFTNDQGKAAAAPGAYVVMADAGINPHYYRLSHRESGDLWALDVSSKSVTADVNGTGAYIIGPALVDPTQPWDATGNPYQGSAQDVYLLSGTVNVNP